MTGNPNNDNSTPEDAIKPDDEADPDRWGGEPQEEIDTSQWVQVNQASYDHESHGELVTALAEAIADAKDVDPLDRTRTTGNFLARRLVPVS